MTKYIDIVFDGPPGPVCGRFVEVEDDRGYSRSIGKWIDHENGLWALRIPCTPVSDSESLRADPVTVAVKQTTANSIARLQRDDSERERVMAEVRGDAYDLIEATLNKLGGGNYERTSGDRTIAVGELLWTLAVLLEDGGDDDAENTIRMAALMARGQ